MFSITFIRTAVVALILFIVTSVSFAAAPVLGPIYVIEGAIGSCGSQSFGSYETRVLTVAPLAASARDVLLVVNPARAPITQSFASGLIPPTDGTCLLSTVTTAVDGPFNVYWRVTAIRQIPPTATEFHPETASSLVYIGLIAAMTLLFGLGYNAGFVTGRI